jgi:TM2 domain-containing membrane protein YozV
MIDENEISKKSPLLTLFLCLVFGSLGAHRFYVGKYFTGAIYLLIGGTSIVLDFMGIGYAFIAKIIYALLIIIDTYALYSESFTDSKGKLITDNESTLVYNTLAEREAMISDRNSNKLLIFLAAFIFYLSYFLIKKFVL